MRKVSLLLLVLVLLVGIFSGCAEVEKMELPNDMTDKEFFEEGMSLVNESLKNIEIKDYKINLDNSFISKYKNYNLDNKKQAFYNMMSDLAINYNKYKETDEEKYIDLMTNKVKEIGVFFKTNNPNN